MLGGRYELLDLIGSGGMGTVHRARDRMTGQVVALKRVTSAGGPETSVNARLAIAREFSVLASLRHPNIISVLDYDFEEDGRPFFTMSLLPAAVTVLDAAQEASPEDRIQLLFQILEALAYLHRRGIVHRDLKPSNVLVQGREVTVVDFGLASRAGERQSGGTVHYMAPEVLRGEEPSVASDLYAIGVIAYEMLAGRHPFSGSVASGFLHRVLDRAPDVKRLQAPPAVANIVVRLLAKDPEERFDDANRLIGAFADAAGMDVPPETAALRESYLFAAPFVDRTEEMARLGRALEHACDGAGSSWLLAGESGIGKSRFLDELRARAQVRGALVLNGQAVREGGAPFLLFRAPLLRLCLEVEPTPAEAAVLAATFPDFQNVLDTPVAPAAPDPQGAAQRLGDVVESLFSRVRRPVLLELEDCHLAQEGLHLLARLNRIVRTLPLLIVASYRDDERPGLPDEHPDMGVVRLARFGRDEIAELASSILDRRRGRDHRLLALLQHETEGNAFFVLEAIRAIGEDAGRLARITASDLPEHVFSARMKALVRRRLDKVPEAAWPLLRLQAVLGRDVDETVLRAIEPEEDVRRWLALCTDAAVFEPHGYGFRFAHDKLREAVLDDLDDATRRALHRRVAIGVEAAHGDSPVWINALAAHWREAGDVDRAVPWLVAAAVQMLQSGAPEEAVVLGLDAVRMLGIDIPEPQLRGLAIGREMGEIYRLLAGRPPAALLDLPELADPRVGTAIGVLRLVIPGAHISHQFELFALCVLKCVALSLEYGNGAHASFAYATYAIVARGMTGDSRLAYAFGDLAMELDRRRLGRPSGSVGFVHAWFINHWINPVATSLPLFHAAADAGFEEGDLTYACFSVASLPIFMRAHGERLDSIIAQAAASLERIDERVAVAAFHTRLERQVARALAGHTRDPLSLSDHACDEAAELTSICSTANQTQISYYYSARLRLHYFAGEYERALRYAEQATHLLTSFQGQVEESEWSAFHGLALVARACETTGETRSRLLARAEEIRVRFTRWADTCAANFEHKALLIGAELAAAAGSGADAGATFERAATEAAAHGFRQYAALAHERAARFHLARRDREAAVRQVRLASERYLDWGAHARVDAMRGLLAEIEALPE